MPSLLVVTLATIINAFMLLLYGTFFLDNFEFSFDPNVGAFGFINSS